MLLEVLHITIITIILLLPVALIALLVYYFVSIRRKRHATSGAAAKGKTAQKSVATADHGAQGTEEK